MRLIFCFLFLVLIQSATSAQNLPRIDSLRSILNTATTSAGRVELMYQLGDAWAEASFDSAYLYASRIIGEHGDSPDALMKGYRVAGLAYDYQYVMDSAESNYRRSLQLAMELNDTVFMAILNFNLGTLHLLEGNYASVLPYYDRAIVLLQGRPDGQLYLSKVFTNLGIVYRRTKRYEDAIDIYRKALLLLDPTEDRKLFGELCINTGNAFSALEEFDSARFYYDRALQVVDHTRDKFTYYYASNGLGIVSYEQNRLEEAMLFFRPVASDSTLSDSNLRITALGYLGSISQKLNQPGRAREYFAAAWSYADEENFPDQTMEFYLQLADFYESAGDQAQALFYLKKHHALASQLLTQEVIDKTAEWEERFRNQEKEKEIISLELKNEEASLYAQQQANQRNFFLFLAIVLTIVALFSFYLYLARKRSAEQLRAKNEVIQQALADKEMLMKEIHHRVKNNLQVISSLLNLQSNLLKDSAANAAVLESKNRVHAMALIHQTLYQDDKMAVIDAAQYLEQLVGNLEQSYNSSEKRIRLETAIDPLQIDVDKMILLGLIVNELLTNAYKYAFEGLDEGIIELTLKAEQDKVLFRLRDNGVGMREKTSGREGLGMLLIRDFARKLGTVVQFRSAGGTEVEMILSRDKMMLV